MNVVTRDKLSVARRTRRPMRLGALLLLLLLAGGALWWFVWRTPGASTRSAGTQTAARGRAGGHEPIPVLLATADQRDVPIYLDGLGTVQASQTVTVKPQVDGKLVEVLFSEGQDVKKGDVLARIDPRTYQAALDQAVAKKQQDEASLANARLDLTRYQKLAATAYTSAQTSDTQRATVAQDVALVGQDQAQIDTARTNLSYTTITAPIDGRTGLRQVDQGNIVHAADTTGIVVLTTLRPIAVIFTLPQQQLAQVTAAMAAGAPEALAMPQDVSMRPNAAVLDHGALAVLDNQVDSSTGTIKLKALFPNDGLRLWPGAFVTVRLHVSTDTGATVVPEAAVQRGPDGAFVYLVGSDSKAARRAVVVGHEDLSGAVVKSGVAVGDRVVVDGAARLTDGAQVTVAQPPGAQTPGTVQPAPDSAARPSHRRAPAVSGAS